jgi:hypothetical protein
MRRIVFLLISVIFLGGFFLWFIYLRNQMSDFFNIAEWGGYFFAIPLFFSVIAICSYSTLENFGKISIYVFGGILFALSLNRILGESFFLSKIIATMVGGIISWGITKLPKR